MLEILIYIRKYKLHRSIGNTGSGAFAMENTADSAPQFFSSITIPKIMFLGIVID